MVWFHTVLTLSCHATCFVWYLSFFYSWGNKKLVSVLHLCYQPTFPSPPQLLNSMEIAITTIIPSPLQLLESRLNRTILVINPTFRSPPQLLDSRLSGNICAETDVFIFTLLLDSAELCVLLVRLFRHLFGHKSRRSNVCYQSDFFITTPSTIEYIS